jgi:hypothetical protein
MSVTRAIAQIPRGQSRFVVNTGNNGHGDMFLQSDFDEWYANNASVLTKLGNGKTGYLITNNDFYNVARDLPHELGFDFLQQYDDFTLMDMGAEITMGTPAEPRQIVFRKVKLPSASDDLGNSLVGYVVTENNHSDMTRPRLLCAVARS